MSDAAVHVNRRGFLKLLGFGTVSAAAASTGLIDVERLLWVPGERTIFVPERIYFNEYLPPHWMEKEALRILENQLEVTRLINRDYSRFDQIGLKVGDTLHVRLPMRWEAKRIGPDRKTLETVEMVITDRYPR